MKVSCGLCLVGRTLKSWGKIEKETEDKIKKAEARNLFMQSIPGHFSLDFSEEWLVNPYLR